MQLLARLEVAPRDAYTGSMGYLGVDGSLDLNILIRTLTVADRRIDFRTGAGIVADSDPAAELDETRAKAQGLLRALGSET
jgi:anthranilate synthase component 1